MPQPVSRFEVSVERVITTIAAAAIVGVIVWAVDDSSEDAKVATILEGLVEEVKALRESDMRQSEALANQLLEIERLKIREEINSGMKREERGE